MYVCTHSDHKCQIVQLYHIIINKRRSIQCQSLTKSSLDKFWNDLNSQLHTFAPRNDNPDEIYQNLLNAITNLFRKYCNIKKFNLKHNIVLVLWATKGIGRCRDIMYELYDKKSYFNSDDFNDYVILKYLKEYPTQANCLH